ncbi:unnamed protein product, partial [Nippostrongylus brasiliensis]|uniref:Presenilin spe-4 (inferred by orthology to a C. elegans protein) n=1 Tax=Nippostrongylus brasiliensis TaxID=27835 RepID=A0A0N4Y0I1_NIPBR
MRQTCQCDRFLCRLVSQFGEVSKLLRPVTLNMAMTLTAWIYVYDMKTDERLSAMFLMSGNSTTGNQYHDGIINAFSAMVVLAIVSFSMLLLALWDCRRLVQLDLLKSLKISEEKIIYEYLPGLVTAYGGFGCIVLRFLMFTADTKPVDAASKKALQDAQDADDAEADEDDSSSSDEDDGKNVDNS